VFSVLHVPTVVVAEAERAVRCHRTCRAKCRETRKRMFHAGRIDSTCWFVLRHLSLLTFRSCTWQQGGSGYCDMYMAIALRSNRDKVPVMGGSCVGQQANCSSKAGSAKNRKLVFESATQASMKSITSCTDPVLHALCGQMRRSQHVRCMHRPPLQQFWAALNVWSHLVRSHSSAQP
jgi:hypothetical protein